jgi:DNA polymerase III sliding clamp (beta) subunit (PCNA family)
MKLSIKTTILQEMVSRVIKGASQNKLIPLTSLMAIQLKSGKLTLITTDASNTLYIMQDKVEGDDFYCVVPVEQFSKLVSKMSSENITLLLDNNILTINGNGIYKIELPLDENGETIKYPDPLNNSIYAGELTEVNLSTIKTILGVNKAALAVTMEEPVYTGYYVGDRVVSTDTYKICGLDVKLFDTPVLIAPETMNLLDVMTAEKISIYVQDDIIKFVSDDCVVYSHKMDGIEDYAIDAISGLLNESFESSCKIRKIDLLSTLDRIALFVGVYDNKAITLTFADNQLDISSKKANGVESITYMENKNFKPYTCQINIEELIQQVKANSADNIEIQYGNEKSIKLVDGNITQIIALLTDDN